MIAARQIFVYGDIFYFIKSIWLHFICHMHIGKITYISDTTFKNSHVGSRQQGIKDAIVDYSDCKTI